MRESYLYDISIRNVLIETVLRVQAFHVLKQKKRKKNITFFHLKSVIFTAVLQYIVHVQTR